jgi:hypothetical protein
LRSWFFRKEERIDPKDSEKNCIPFYLSLTLAFVVAERRERRKGK